MKNIILILITLTLVLTACDGLYEPEADFKVSSTKVGIDEEVCFYNYSHHADDYEWDFDDGTISYDSNPVHRFSEPGTYNVRLSAFHEDKTSEYYMTIDVIEPDLVIQVLEYNDLYVVENAKVILYPTLADWDAQTFAVASGYTDKYGVIRFYDLEEGFYFMDISNNNHDNYDLANEDIGYIQTPYIGFATTKINAYVDYIGTKSARISRKISPVPTKRPFDIKMREWLEK